MKSVCVCTRLYSRLACFLLSPPLQEEQNRGKPNWEHLNEELHVLITVEDTENRAKMKIQRAMEEIRKLLVPSVSGQARPCHTHTYTYIPTPIRA